MGPTIEVIKFLRDLSCSLGGCAAKKCGDRAKYGVVSGTTVNHPKELWRLSS